MKRVCIGIPFRERADLLATTLQAVQTFTPATSTVVLADGPDAQSRGALAGAACDRVLSWDRSFGDAGCFNRLVSENDAEIYVLLENGARVSPGWLDRLRGALAADPSHGLCGPSTNRSWNEQQVFADCQGGDADLSRVACEAAERFADSYVTLAPLHSLADFCYAVTREVVDRIGAADEGYGEGPCWEMDYNIRAARAGFRGIWAKAAFVWRSPATPRRQTSEARRFSFSKRRYQEHFCALHLRKETRRYEAHCTGEACEHFAPPVLITIRRELPEKAIPASTMSLGAAVGFPPLRDSQRTAERPIVSCIMPTANRRMFVAQAIAAFLQQDYEPRELIIIDDGSDAIEDLVPGDQRIRYVRSSRGQSLGRKRNEACRLAHGDVIVHWDDDDWHASWRLSYQVGRLLASEADICGLERVWFYDADQRRAWQYRYPGGRSRWLAGGSFCYRRKLWERQRFSDVTVGEDTRFVREATFAKIATLDRDDFYVARVHADNTCRKQLSGVCWVPVPRETVEQIIDRCRAQISLPSESPGQSPSAPLVSCIMPTYNRPSFVALALQRFAEQSYPNKELIVVDDGLSSIEHLAATTAGVRYLRIERRSIGEKRNAACAAARGDIVVHWDDDDWYGRERLERQLDPILAGHADITGLRCRWLMTLPEGEFWQVSPELHRRMFVADVHGGTLMFRKRLWDAGARYPATNLAEDADMLRAALQQGARLQVLDNEGDFVYSRHGTNAWRFPAGEFIEPKQWRRSPQPAEMSGSIVDQYQEAFRALASAHSSDRLRRSVSR